MQDGIFALFPFLLQLPSAFCLLIWSYSLAGILAIQGKFNETYRGSMIYKNYFDNL
jgi:hypothetical protein